MDAVGARWCWAPHICHMVITALLSLCCPTVAPGCPLCSLHSAADRSGGSSRILEADCCWLQIPNAVVIKFR